MIAVKISSNGSVFYPWNVLGKNGKPFTGYKFRTMIENRLQKTRSPIDEIQG